jgi:UDP-N-acetylmuramoyl-L-alanyl-D-glutamate--2,6-diaminopimelate ligase
MGKIASEKSNWGIITADNPRYESLEVITSQIFVGISSDLKKNWTIINDRENAIATAIKQAKAQDIILVAGKGHESTQEINGNFINFSDREVVTRILSGSK